MYQLPALQLLDGQDVGEERAALGDGRMKLGEGMQRRLWALEHAASAADGLVASIAAEVDPRLVHLPNEREGARRRSDRERSKAGALGAGSRNEATSQGHRDRDGPTLLGARKAREVR